MIYIQKRRTPEMVKNRANEIKNEPYNDYAGIVLPKDSSQLRDLFEQMPKNEIREALYREQHGLCAYCMGRIISKSSGMKIEHYKALSRNKEGALDYQNYLGVCYGGEKEGDEKPHVLCCDAVRKDRELNINPWDKRQMEAIAYHKNGEIFIRTDKGLDPGLIKNMQKDVDEVLGLNGVKSEDGRILYDTASKLVASRRSICDSVHSQFERWDKKKCLTVDFLQEKINKLEKMLEGDHEAEPYIGVRLYFYKRKQEKLRRRLDDKKHR
ncbi:MAG: TIGR02646 family protein [Lachnospiraceae bacterium]|nr:TIGR02646 family protein [Lachnospiraceae bacterium]